MQVKSAVLILYVIGLMVLFAGTACAQALSKATLGKREQQTDRVSNLHKWCTGNKHDFVDGDYDVSSRDGILRALNHAQNFQVTFDAAGAVVSTNLINQPNSAPWNWGLTFDCYGWEGSKFTDCVPVLPQAKNNTTTYNREEVVEWYVNDSSGLRSWFKFNQRPQGNGNLLQLEFTPRGNLIPITAPGRAGIQFGKQADKPLINFDDLKAWDAHGRELACRITKDRGKVIFKIEAADAVFPVTVDPLASTPVWRDESNQSNSDFGYSMSTAGDVNGDGYSDCIVGAPAYDNGHSGEGKVYLYYGSPDGLTTAPVWTRESDIRDGWYGLRVTLAGDVNGDSYSDVLISGNGVVHAFYGSPDGLAATPNWIATAEQPQSDFGSKLSSAGDVNGDGYSDIIIGAPAYLVGINYVGRAVLFLGSESGLQTTPARVFQGDGFLLGMGQSISTAGDINSDGYSDIIIKGHTMRDGYSYGKVFVYHGSGSGLMAAPSWISEINQSANYGSTVASVGDINGDGYSDITIGASGYYNGQANEGAVFLYYGSSTGLSSNAAWMFEGNAMYAYLGYSCSPGDVNGDGYPDLMISGPNYANYSGSSTHGRLYGFYGSAEGLATTPDLTILGTQWDSTFPGSLTSAGDVNGDGYSDMLAADRNYSNGQYQHREGCAYLYLGSASGLSSARKTVYQGEQAGSLFGQSVATAGDVNGDGLSDVIVGSPLFDTVDVDTGQACIYLGTSTGISTEAAWTATGSHASAHFGHSVASAGDVNGDGYSDVIVGAPGTGSDDNNAGHAYVYLGGSTGVSPLPAWSVTNNQVSSSFGYSVNSAGDVNGDGYFDVLIGAPQYSNNEAGEGATYLYLGSPSGLYELPVWITESNQSGARLGHSVSGAGDVNNDGFYDFIIGSPLYDGEHVDSGMSQVYFGTASELSLVPAWIKEGEAVNERLGWSVATAADTNADGYSDIILGAPYFSNGDTNEGRIFHYRGSASGLSTSPALTAESNIAGAYLGMSVSTAGDINGDGYSDFIIGAPGFTDDITSAGKAFLFSGTSAELTTTPLWTDEGDESSLAFAAAVAIAGDVNGDSYSDVIIGAPSIADNQTSAGKVVMFFGNSEAATGKGIAPRQRLSDDSSPISLGGGADNATDIRLAVLGRSPFGRTKVKLEWEIKPSTTAFDGTGTSISSQWIDTAVSGTVLNELVSLPELESRFHWRTRLLYYPATAPWQLQSRWVTPEMLASRTFVRTSSTTEDMTPPALVSLQAQSANSLDISYNEAMGNGALDPANYVISGLGMGTVASHPTLVTAFSGQGYRLIWNSGRMATGGNITITVSGVSDLAGNSIGADNSISTIAVPVELSVFSLE